MSMFEAFWHVDIVQSNGLCVEFLDTASASVPFTRAICGHECIMKGLLFKSKYKGLGMLDISLLSNMPTIKVYGLWQR